MTAVLDTPATAGITTVNLSGEIDIFTSKALRARLLRALHSAGSGTLVADLSRVTFCDTVGLGVLVGIQRRAKAMGVSFALAAPRPNLVNLLAATGLDHRLPTASVSASERTSFPFSVN